MKMTRRVLVLCLLGWLVTLAAGESPRKTVSVLFVGNSYTYVNDLPALVEELLASRGVKLEHESATPGGATLERTWGEGKALAALQSRHWDYVVLQEQSQRPFKEREAMFRAARIFHEAIQKAGAKTLLYETWAPKAAPDEQPKLTEAYEALGRELSVPVVPAGEAWKRATAGGVDLYGPDGRHPGRLGTYLTACVLVRALTGQPAAGLPAQVSEGKQPWAHPDAAEAKALQEYADAEPRK